MRASRLIALLPAGLIAAGCGWSPPGSAPTNTAGCTAAEGPTQDSIVYEINQLPELPEGQKWRPTISGHTADCRLHWAQVTSGDASDAPQQAIFFDHNSPIGTVTPDPRPYITVVPIDNDTATVQYQWRQGQDPACCPTGSGTVRVKVEDGKLKTLDPIPNA